MQNKLFLCYSNQDKDFVDGLVAALKQRGITIWFDRQDLHGGDAWRAAIANAIRQCKAFLLIITPSSSQSPNVIRELSIAEKNRRPIIPILYGLDYIPGSMEYQIAHLHVIDFTHQSFEQALQALKNAIDNVIPASVDLGMATVGNSQTNVYSNQNIQNPRKISPKSSSLPVGLIIAFTMIITFVCCGVIWWLW
jgi:hypothetical protein